MVVKSEHLLWWPNAIRVVFTLTMSHYSSLRLLFLSTSLQFAFRFRYLSWTIVTTDQQKQKKKENDGQKTIIIGCVETVTRNARPCNLKIVENIRNMYFLFFRRQTENENFTLSKESKLDHKMWFFFFSRIC